MLIKSYQEVKSRYCLVITIIVEKYKYVPSLEYKSSRPEVLYKAGVHENFAKFTRKHLCHSLF